MGTVYRLGFLSWVVVSAAAAIAAETVLFNGKNLDGWSYHAKEDEKITDIGDNWIVKDGLLINTGASSGYLLHQGEFENYVLTLEWRTMSTEEGHGVAVGSGESVYLHTGDEPGSFGAPKSIEVSLGDPGAVYFRDVKPFDETQEWAFHAPDFADEVDADMGEWNLVKIISNGKRLTVYTNDVAVNQIDEMTRSKGAIALKCSRGFIQAPTFYRNVRIEPITDAALQDEKNAAVALAKFKAKHAAEEAAREAERLAEEQAQQAKEASLAKDWTDLEVTQEIPFKPDARYLPFPADAHKIEFDATFGGISFTFPTSLVKASAFYRKELSRRGWQVTETDLDEDRAEVTFENGDAELELTLYESSQGVDVRMDCEGLAFDGTNDPEALASLGVPQPKAYRFLQRELDFPDNVQNLEYDRGTSCMFKSALKLDEAFDFFGKQLRAKGYRETRRPILDSDRHYTEFAKGRDEVSVNIFTDPVGTRIILDYEEKR